jgi:hypothetical protein
MDCHFSKKKMGKEKKQPESDVFTRTSFLFPSVFPTFNLANFSSFAYSCVSARYTSPPHPATLHAWAQLTDRQS